VIAPRLDFIIIGAQKGGTTSLWQYLRHHPSILMPDSKEEPFFSTGRTGDKEWEAFVETHFDEPAGRLLGKATPPYMLGGPHLDVAGVAERIARAFPTVRLIALLRDPIDRALSQWRMSVRQGVELRSFEEAMAEQLEPDSLRAERSRPSRTDSYVIAGEYGRILGAYRERFPAERMLVEESAELERDPAGTLDRVLEFLGLPGGFRPQGLEVRHNRGGRRLDGLGEAQLFDFLERRVWPRLNEGAGEARDEFERFYEEWSAIPNLGGGAPRPTSAEIRERLQAHYTADAIQLGELGIDAPWLNKWGR
jgi:Sulfotransferase domain